MVHGTSHTCLSGLLLFFKRDKKKNKRGGFKLK
jgi:hypothetical protein